MGVLFVVSWVFGVFSWVRVGLGGKFLFWGRMCYVAVFCKCYIDRCLYGISRYETMLFYLVIEFPEALVLLCGILCL